MISAGPRSGYQVRGPSRRRPPKAEPHAPSRYAARGVSASKREVHAAIARWIVACIRCLLQDHGGLPDGDPDLCNVIHADGSGSKSLLGYLRYRETGDASVFRGIAQDSIVMNLDDLLCVGAARRIVCRAPSTATPSASAPTCSSSSSAGTDAFLARLREQGVDIHNGGGETADVGDLTPTLVVDSCTTTVMRKSDVITGDGIRPGLSIVGLASAGQASYEDAENSGIGSNGLTSARHDFLSAHYRRNTRRPSTRRSRRAVYTGPFRLADSLPGSKLSVGEALLSPTRSYAPVITALLAEQAQPIKGIVHCSGGGQTKCLRFGRNVHFVKDSMLPIPAIFKVIQARQRHALEGDVPGVQHGAPHGNLLPAARHAARDRGRPQLRHRGAEDRAHRESSGPGNQLTFRTAPGACVTPAPNSFLRAPSPLPFDVLPLALPAASASALAAALAIDLLLGELPSRVHPVVWMGT